MPSDIMDQRHMSSLYRPSVPSSLFPDEVRFPSELQKQVGFWKNGSVPDHRGLETVSFTSGGKISLLEKFRPAVGNFVDSLEPQHSYLLKNPKRNISFEHHLPGTESTTNCWRAPSQDTVSLSRLYGQPAMQSVEAKRVIMDEGHYENALFSNSLSDTLNRKLRLPSDDIYVQSVGTTQSNFADKEAFESSEEIEAKTIGDLLPDDDELLSGALQDLGYVTQTNKEDVEDDLFCSVGGLELDNFPSSERPCGECPSRTLFVKNINGIEDLELRILFEQFGETQALFTACRHRGFIMVSYYDIRAAENAIRVLQTNSIRNQKLDMHFCLPADNPSEKDINLGVLVVTNLDSSISDDDILQIFGAWGQIKQICELQHKRGHKFVEFYDVRDAEAALSALNMSDIAGKRIKVEPCCPGDASSIGQLALDLEEQQSNGRRGESSGFLRNGAMHGMLPAFDMPNGSFMNTQFQAGVPHSLSSSVRVGSMGNFSSQSGEYELGNSLSQRNNGFQNMPSFPEFHGGAINGLPFISPGTMSAMANISSSLNNGIDNRNIGRFGSVGDSCHSFERKEATNNFSGSRSCGPHSLEHIWNNHPLAWQNMSPFMNRIPSQTAQMRGLNGILSHLQNPVSPFHQHVSSAPVLDPSLFEGRHTFSVDTAVFQPCSPVHVSHNMFPHATGRNCIDPSSASSHVGIPSPGQRCHMLRGRNNANSISHSHDAPNDRIRSRRNDSGANQLDNRKQFELDIDRIIRGEDSRTTLMIKNIPNKYTSKMLLATIDEQHKGTYDFIYLPIDFKNKCNVGYAFINMTDPQHIIPFYQAFSGKKWEKFNSEKVASLAYGRIQGKAALIAHFQNSSLMNEDKRCRPILFHSNGPNAGDQEPFPVGVTIRSARSRTNGENHEGSPSGSSSGEESSNVINLSEQANFPKAF